jgi:signal transduction histidine kinase
MKLLHVFEPEAKSHVATAAPHARLLRDMEELRDEVARLRGSLAARDEFVARAAQELRNPMAAVVLGATNLAFLARREASTAPAVLERVELLRQQANHFVRRATTLLEAARLAAGRADLEPTTFDLGSVVLLVVEQLAPDAQRAGCDLDLEIGRVVGCWDRAAIESITSNLISNALAYGAGAPVSIRVTEAPGKALLAVADQGPGISPDDEARIHGPFDDLGLRPDRPGFGVGLWSARQFALAHGGELAVDHPKGRGCIFTASLPRGIHDPHT